MKKVVLLLVLTIIVFPVFGQPWLRYMSPSKSGSRIEEYQALKKAFNTYIKNHKRAETGQENENQDIFERWEWLVDQRVTRDRYIQSEILWDELQKKIEAGKNGGFLGNWQFIGPEETPTDINSGQLVGSGRVDCIAFHPTDSNTFWIGAPTGGLWKTTDNGKTWHPLTDHIASIGISDIALYPYHPDTLFIATGDRDARDLYSAGILKSTDGGLTWDTTAMSFSQHDKDKINRLIIRPDRPDTMIAATSNGIYFITGMGDSLQKVQAGNFKDLEFMPGNPDVVYAAMYGYGNAAVYRSDNAGKSFHRISDGITTSELIRIDLAVSADSPNMIMALCAEKTNSGLYAIYRSFNKGDTWTKLLSGSTKNLLGNSSTGDGDDGQGWYDLTMAISPDDYKVIYVGGINVWKTLNGGGSWHLSSWGYPESGSVEAPYMHVDQHISAFNPLTGALYFGNDGGLYRTYDQGATWEDLSSGLAILQIYRIGLSASKRAMAMMGSQDNSSILWNDTAWNVVLGGDGMECIIDYTDNNTLYASSQYGNIRRSTDGGHTFSGIKPPNAGKGAWVTPYLMFPDDHKALLAGFSEIYKSEDQGESWEKLTDYIQDNLRALAVSSYNPDVMYAATREVIYISENGGKTWNNIVNNLPQERNITGITIAQYDARKVWVSLSNYNKNSKVFMTEDGGAHWSNYSDGLPNVPANCILYQNNSNSTLYVGTDLGIYVRDNSMEAWKDFSGNLPNVIVNEMEIYYPDSMLRAGTYGRGLWETKIFIPDTLSLYAEFTGDRLSSCLQSDFTFYNKYPGMLDSLIWTFDPDGIPHTLKNKDTVRVSFNTPGDKDITLIVFYRGHSDTLTRPAYVKAVSSIDLKITTNFSQYYWHGNPADLKASGADNYMWISSPGQDTLYGNEITVFPDTNVVYTLYGQQGSCADTDTVSITVWPNDNIRYALPLSYGDNGPFFNYEATVEEHEPAPPAGDCNTDSTWCDEFGTGQGYLAHSVWFYFIAPPGGRASIDSRGFDNQIAVYDAASSDSLLAGNYNLLAANDDYHDQDMQFAAATEALTDLTPGEKYWVQVDGSGGNTTGTFYLTLYDSPLGIGNIRTKSEEKAFVVFPNPNDGDFSLLFYREIPPSSRIKIFSGEGKMIFWQPLPAAAAGQTLSIPVTLKNKGIYLIQVILKDKMFAAKMMVR